MSIIYQSFGNIAPNHQIKSNFILLWFYRLQLCWSVNLSIPIGCKIPVKLSGHMVYLVSADKLSVSIKPRFASVFLQKWLIVGKLWLLESLSFVPMEKAFMYSLQYCLPFMFCVFILRHIAFSIFANFTLKNVKHSRVSYLMTAVV